jgi:hypothetical protein
MATTIPDAPWVRGCGAATRMIRFPSLGSLRRSRESNQMATAMGVSRWQM